LLVEATYSTRRVPIEPKNSTYSRRSQTVSTVKKSQARTVCPRWRRNDPSPAVRAVAPAGSPRGGGRVQAVPVTSSSANGSTPGERSALLCGPSSLVRRLARPGRRSPRALRNQRGALAPPRSGLPQGSRHERPF
jgi:hypothetical protein